MLQREANDFMGSRGEFSVLRCQISTKEQLVTFSDGGLVINLDKEVKQKYGRKHAAYIGPTA